MNQVLRAFARNTVFANITIALILLSGVLALKLIVREVFPQFSLDMIQITVPYPGADPEEVEEGVSRKIEEAIEAVEGIKQYTTHSSENLSQTLIEVKKGYKLAEVMDSVRSQVDSISTFPVDAEKAIISEVVFKDTVMLLSLSGDLGERRLKEEGENLKESLQQLPSISQVQVLGARDYEINIELSEERLRQYGLSLDQVAEAVAQSNLNLAGGTIRTSGEDIRLRTMGRKYTGPQLAKIVVLARANGEIITLDRLARIRDGFGEDPQIITVNGKRAILLNISKTKEEDALAISKDVHALLAELRAVLPPGVELCNLYDGTDMLRSRMNLLTKNGLIGLIMVLLVLWLFLDWRLSFWAGMGIPISLAGGLTILWLMGGTINMISLFAMIMVLGIIVDDAIVVGEAIFVKRQEGLPPLAAAVQGVSEIGMPVVAAVFTTIITFLPLAFIGGIMGKFIAILPTMVISCLLVSLVESLLLLPAHLSHLPDPKESRESGDSSGRGLPRPHLLVAAALEWFIRRLYTPLIRLALRWRYVSFCAAVAMLLLAIGFVRGGFLKFEVFPAIDGTVLIANVKFPDGTPAAVTKGAVEKIEAGLAELARRRPTLSGQSLLKDSLAFVGQSVEEPVRRGANLGGVEAILLDPALRGIDSKELLVEWQEVVGHIAGAESLTFDALEQGPPGAPIEIWVQGRELASIVAAARDLQGRLAKFSGVYQIHSDFSPGKSEIRLTLKPAARTLGLTVADLARQLHAGYYGREVLRLQRGRDDVRLKVRYSADERRHLSELRKVRIRGRDGREVPLGSVADIHYAHGYSTITRTDGMRRVVVSAAIDSAKANANEVLDELSRSYYPKLLRRYPGIRVAAQGEKKKMAESFDSLKVGFPLALLGVFVIIATVFRSYVQPFIIMFTIPFGLIGAIAGHLLMGFDLSLMSVFGMVALSGVVVNDAIVLIERVNENLAASMPFIEAIVNAGGRRFRAIFLTTISTVGGLAPLIFETDLQAQFLIPMALSLAAGLLAATLLTLILIPSMLVILNDMRCLVFRLRHGRAASREEVEPALGRTGTN